MAASQLMTLGGFAFSVDSIATPGPATRKARALMAFLIINRDADAARERLLDVFWPDTDPDRARDSLNTALWSIRRCVRTAGLLSEHCIVTTKSTVRWIADTIVDAQQFAELVESDDLEASQAALRLYHGDFLEGDYDNWAVSERERLAALYETVLARLIRTSKDTEAALQFIGRNPYDEAAYVTLIEAELAAGRRTAAVSWLQRCRTALAELGEKPSEAFEGRFGKMVRIEPHISEELTLPFAGREPQLGFIATRLTEAANGVGSITVVHGEAGIGKSTLLDRVEHMGRDNGMNVLFVRCDDGVPSTFGAWDGVFKQVAGGDLESFVRAHASNLAVEVACAITNRLSPSTVLIFDDVHQLTAEALDIFVALASEARAKNVVIAASRPEGILKLRARLVDVPFEELHLHRLERPDMQWALTQALGSEQTHLFDALYNRTAGHPLFFSGLLSSLVSAGTLVRDGRRWQLTKAVDQELELPESVKLFIETRLQTPGDVPRTVACALALEPAARADDLVAVLQMDEATVLDALDDLLALGLILQPATGAQFAFTHALIREVAATGINVARRATLHRLFAKRLIVSSEVNAALRVAHHFKAAGDSLLAAESFLKSAYEALGLSAAQDAIERCDIGIQEAEKLERSRVRELLMAKLQRAAARAAIGLGDTDLAIARARKAVTFARGASSPEELAQAILDLAVTEGAAHRIEEQRSDATEAVRSAKSIAQDALEAQALIQEASAARELGLREDSSRACRSAREIATRCGRSDIMQIALEEELRGQLAWWDFDEALGTARLALESARRAEPLVEAEILSTRAALWYLLERYDDARSELERSLELAREFVAHEQTTDNARIRQAPHLQFFCHYMIGKIAVAERDWDGALGASTNAAMLANVARLPQQKHALQLLRIDALLQRNFEGDGATAHDCVTSLGESKYVSLLGWSDCTQLARARNAARLKNSDADILLRRALNALEENAHRALLDTDLAFSRLADASAELNEGVIANHARARGQYYRSRRLAAAGTLWAGVR